MKAFNEENQRISEMKIGDISFHGDVIIMKVDSLPNGFGSWNHVDQNALALGEVTGHLHQLSGDFELREHPKTKDKYFKVGDVCYLKHQEHAPVKISEGIYKVGIQKEYDHFEEIIREVAD